MPAHLPNATDASAKAFEKTLYGHVPVLDAGARASTLTFAQRNIGDVYLSWENEAYLVLDEFGTDKFDVVTPPSSILAEPPVALVDKMVDKHGTRAVADAYLKFLYTKPAQEIEVKNHYRPVDPECGRRARQGISANQTLHDRSGFRRLDESAGDSFRRWRYIRPDHREVNERRYGRAVINQDKAWGS